MCAVFLPQSNSVPCYDTHYALRLCIEQNLDEACVYIYAAMGLYEESVDLALKVPQEVGVVTVTCTCVWY